MIRDYSGVPVNKTITNTGDEKVKFDIRDNWEQVSIEIPAGDSTLIKVKTSEGVALLSHKVDELSLDMNTEEPEKDSFGNIDALTKEYGYKLKIRKVPTITFKDVMMRTIPNLIMYSIVDTTKNTATGLKHKEIGLANEGNFGGLGISYHYEVNGERYSILNVYFTSEDIEFIKSTSSITAEFDNTTSGWYSVDTREGVYKKMSNAPEDIDFKVNVISVFDTSSGAMTKKYNDVSIDNMKYLVCGAEITEVPQLQV